MSTEMPKAPSGKPMKASGGGPRTMPMAPSAKPGTGAGEHEDRKGPARTPPSLGPRAIA